MNEALNFSSESIRPFLKQSSQELRLDLHVRGVRCGHCVQKIESEINKNSGIERYQFSAGGEKLSLWGLRADVFVQMMNGIKVLGFETVPLKQLNDVEFENQDYRLSLKRIAVAGVCAGNIMLFSVAIYLGADKAFAHFFNKLSLALVVPVLLYSALPIWQGFFKSLRYRKFNLDLPIGLALSMGFIFSLYSLLEGREAIFFDSLSVVVFLILVSRFILRRQLLSIEQKNITQLVPGVFQARRVNEKGENWVGLDQVKRKDVVLVKKGETFPVDGELLDQQALVDLSHLTGESKPVRLFQGDQIMAGSRLALASSRVLVSQVGDQTQVGEYIKKAIEQGIKATEESFRWVSFFTLLVVVISSLALFFFSFTQGLALAFERAFAIIIVACPCAVSFGIPLIRNLTSRLCMQNGIIIKEPKVLTRLLKLQHICFDKTGTLTRSQVEVNQSDFNQLIPEDQEKLLSLELQMEHPISNGFRVLKGKEQTLRAVENFQYQSGQGISGSIDGELWEVRSKQEDSGLNDKVGKKLFVYKNNHFLASVRIDIGLKNGLPELFQFLSEKDKKISILSGDTSEEVSKVKELIPTRSQGEFLSSASPEDKSDLVKKWGGQSLMVGDGINDIAAMGQAPLSLCMPGVLRDNLSVADICLTRGDLKTFKRVFKMAEKVKKVERRLLIFTFSYNMLCIVLALLGFISPVAAAILMPLSSLTVLSMITLGLRRL